MSSSVPDATVLLRDLEDYLGHLIRVVEEGREFESNIHRDPYEYSRLSPEAATRVEALRRAVQAVKAQEAARKLQAIRDGPVSTPSYYAHHRTTDPLLWKVNQQLEAILAENRELRTQLAYKQQRQQQQRRQQQQQPRTPIVSIHQPFLDTSTNTDTVTQEMLQQAQRENELLRIQLSGATQRRTQLEHWIQEKESVLAKILGLVQEFRQELKEHHHHNNNHNQRMQRPSNNPPVRAPPPRATHTRATIQPRSTHVHPPPNKPSSRMEVETVSDTSPDNDYYDSGRHYPPQHPAPWQKPQHPAFQYPKDPAGHNPEWTQSSTPDWNYDPPSEYSSVQYHHSRY
jgi:hypothetical protein